MYLQDIKAHFYLFMMKWFTVWSWGSVAVQCLIYCILCGEAGMWLRTVTMYAAKLSLSLLSSTHCPGPLERASATANVFPGAYSPQDSTRCMSAAFRLWSGFAPLSGNPYQLHFDSTTALHCQTAVPTAIPLCFKQLIEWLSRGTETAWAPSCFGVGVTRWSPPLSLEQV